ncbi:ABC transporter permease [Sodalis ligni]|uniref:Peptide/nickel transport system permease protein n=1 Tax=Sodalis ligni TaxID=2697027 RepID=A0A4R1NFZ1_9GAMM|nr:ABC transporter permease [Sodalis ligni]TCL03586.1 peptide/nickel transport system permease protein [Sodalis ligni]
MARLRGNALLFTGGLVVVAMLTVSLATLAVSPYDLYALDPLSRLKAPDSHHWFGTDNFGRDLFIRVAFAIRISLAVGLSVTVSAGVLGMVIGLLSAGYRVVDLIAMRICDGLFAFPSLLLAIAIVGILGPDIANVVLALSLVYIPSVARVVRSAALSVKEKNYIEGLRAQGASDRRIIWLHIMPNVLPPFIVQMTFIFSVAILTEAALSFLGSGVPAPMPSLGNLLLEGKKVIFTAWWMTFFPGISIILLILALNLAGDGLRDLLDPNIKPLSRSILRRLRAKR